MSSMSSANQRRYALYTPHASPTRREGCAPYARPMRSASAAAMIQRLRSASGGGVHW